MFKYTSLIATLAFSIFTYTAVMAQEEVLLTIDGNKITTQDFMAVYNKNNVDISSAEEKTVEEYLDLFINFKLKVIDAEHDGLDTVAKFQKELAGYVSQLAEPYLTDSTYEEGLIKEAYNRMLVEVHAEHIMVKVAENAPPEDTLAAWNTINKYYQEIMDGADFGNMARNYSDDPSAKENGGDLGYFSVFRMVYPFESAAYNTPVVETSKPFRTAYGYHIMRVLDTRPARGQIKVAHIMVIANDKSTPEEKANAERKANEIYIKLQNGADFGQLAKQFSDDRGSAKKGGELPWFGAGKMVPEFENAAFALQNDGDFSKPVQTRFGWHIIKRIAKRSIGTYEEEYNSIKKKVEKDQRSRGSEHALVLKLMADYKVKVNQKAKTPYYTVVDSSYFEGSWDQSKASGLEAKIFTINDKKYGKKKVAVTQKDFTIYLAKNMRRMKPVAIPVVVDRMFAKFIDDKILEYEESILTIKYPEYKALVTEYHDGILLFEVMEKKVWKKAVEDTAGLEAFYQEHMDNYMWGDRVKASIYTCSDMATAEKVSALLKENATDSAILAEINEKTQLAVSNKKGNFELEQEPVLSQIDWQVGVSKVVPIESVYLVVKVEELLPAQPKSLNEVRGLVTSAYQDYLDEQWVRNLKEKYTVVINQEALNAIK